MNIYLDHDSGDKDISRLNQIAVFSGAKNFSNGNRGTIDNSVAVDPMKSYLKPCSQLLNLFYWFTAG